MLITLQTPEGTLSAFTLPQTEGRLHVKKIVRTGIHLVNTESNKPFMACWRALSSSIASGKIVPIYAVNSTDLTSLTV